MARPTDYSQEIIDKANQYVDNWDSIGDVVPQLAGLSIHCGICETTRKRWEEEHPEFRAVCARARAMQEKVLINKGLSRVSDASLSKLLLMKHGYSDRIEQDVKSSDGSMSPNRIEIVAPNAPSSTI